MKLALTLVLAAALVAGCDTQQASNSGESPAVKASPIDLMTSKGSWTGMVSIQTIQPTVIALGFANPIWGPLTNGGIYSEVYVLASEDPIEPTFRATYEDAVLTLEDQSLTITSDGEAVFRWVVSEELRASEHDLSGYQISRYPGSFGPALESGTGFDQVGTNPIFDTIIADHRKACLAAGKTSAECSSGGPGSTSCSVTGCNGAPDGCSTSCSGNRYACCGCTGGGQGAECTCVPNDPQ